MTEIDPEALAALAADLGEEAAAVFARRCAEQLVPRAARLVAAVAESDAAAAHVAALSLHSSAAMVGATALADLLHRLVPGLRAGHLTMARRVLPTVVALAACAAQELRELLSPPVAGGSPRPGPSR
ncbi:hypothetical protein MF406_03530 [Georgenia sp. TF02-10]|uniref:hypothetical protein n=1 Tax=Georgenia sp. TF02-10 TaxID=2917725 RepID=UPI001FA7481D|nr:hypothetical protein [Georgenia sp. TF02-10]UNX55355.1 hypothetical protein MF406_03530 [Georgenia sp. TF02-10]